MARFAAALAPHGSGVVLAGRDGSATGVSAVAVARGDAGMCGAMTTVDDIGAESGRITTVLALQSLIGGGPPGKFGVGARQQFLGDRCSSHRRCVSAACRRRC